MAGTNDIAGNTGPTTIADYQSNIRAMIDLARANGIAVVLAGIPPSRKLFWRGDLDPRPLIRELNGWLRGVAFDNGYVFVDYAAVLADAEGGLRADLGNDGVHPNRVGYARMRPLTEAAIAEAIERAEAPVGARTSLARRNELLASIATGVAEQRASPAPRGTLVPPPTPAKTSRSWDSAPTQPLWPSAPPNGSFVPATLPPGWPAPFVANVAQPELRIFPAQKPNGHGVLAIPGGGYMFVSVQNEGADFAARLNQLGYTVFVLVYRLPAEGWQASEDVPLQDAQRAMRVIRANAARWAIDPRTLSVVGFSAGGHLAATLATDFGQPVYAPVDAADSGQRTAVRNGVDLSRRHDGATRHARRVARAAARTEPLGHAGRAALRAAARKRGHAAAVPRACARRSRRARVEQPRSAGGDARRESAGGSALAAGGRARVRVRLRGLADRELDRHVRRLARPAARHAALKSVARSAF